MKTFTVYVVIYKLTNSLVMEYLNSLTVYFRLDIHDFYLYLYFPVIKSKMLSSKKYFSVLRFPLDGEIVPKNIHFYVFYRYLEICEHCVLW